MAVRRPLVLLDNNITSELPIGDSLPVAQLPDGTADGQSLVWNDIAEDWEPRSLTAADVGAAATSHTHPLSDITQSGATVGQVPQWNGTAWVATTPVPGGSSITWLTVSANTTMDTNTAYNVSGARNMTVGSAAVGDNYIIHAVDATVRVIAGAGREIRYAGASVVSGVTDALTLVKGETVWLVCNATNKLEIV